MRRPIQARNWLTKGLQAIRKSLSLITKGYEDQKIGGKAIPPVEWAGFEYFWLVEGIRKIAFEKIYNLNAIIQKDLLKSCDIIGQKQELLKHLYTVKAISQYQLEYTLTLNGIKEKEIINNLGLYGIKQFLVDTNLDINGIKQLDIDLEKIITAGKSIDFSKDLVLSGCKKDNVDNDLLMQGKRDISPILVALDIFRGGKNDN